MFQSMAILTLVAGAVFYFWSAFHFAISGKGTPAPIDPPKRLVIRGPYHYVRNPMYIGGVLILTGESILFGSATLILYT